MTDVPGQEPGDELPEELDVTGYVGQYTFPDIKRRRIPGIIYVLAAAACFVLWVTHRGSSHVLVNENFPKVENAREKSGRTTRSDDLGEVFGLSVVLVGGGEGLADDGSQDAFDVA